MHVAAQLVDVRLEKRRRHRPVLFAARPVPEKGAVPRVSPQPLRQRGGTVGVESSRKPPFAPRSEQRAETLHLSAGRLLLVARHEALDHPVAQLGRVVGRTVDTKSRTERLFRLDGPILIEEDFPQFHERRPAIEAVLETGGVPIDSGGIGFRLNEGERPEQFGQVLPPGAAGIGGPCPVRACLEPLARLRQFIPLEVTPADLVVELSRFGVHTEGHGPLVRFERASPSFVEKLDVGNAHGRLTADRALCRDRLDHLPIGIHRARLVARLLKADRQREYRLGPPGIRGIVANHLAEGADRL